jgi:transposase-like protein
MTRLSPGVRARLLKELQQHEQFTIKAIAQRNGVSPSTLWRLRDEMRSMNDFRAAVRGNTK